MNAFDCGHLSSGELLCVCTGPASAPVVIDLATGDASRCGRRRGTDGSPWAQTVVDASA